MQPPPGQWIPAQAWPHQNTEDESAGRPDPVKEASTHQVLLQFGEGPFQNLIMIGLQSL